MRFILLILVISIILSCNSKKELVHQSKKTFIHAYKTAVLYGCMDEATGGEFQKFSLENNDLGIAPQVAVIFHAETKEATELGARLSKRIKPSTYGDYEGRTPIFSDCVSFAFFSKEVDSIARKLYNKTRKVE